MSEKTIIEKDVCFTQNVLSPVVILAQWFFLFPVYGVNNGKKYTSVRFKWFSAKTVLSVLFGVYSCFISVLYVYRFVYHRNKIIAMFSLIYHVTVGSIIICFINVATKWPKLMKEWSLVDIKMVNFEKNHNLKRGLWTIVLVFMALGIGEHLFYMASLQSVPRIFQGNFRTHLDAYLKGFYGAVFRIIPYNTFFGVFAEIDEEHEFLKCDFIFFNYSYFIKIMNWQFTLGWNYADIYLVAMCIPLNFRLKQIERKLTLMIRYKIQDPEHWKQLRETFVLVSNICVSIEKCTGHLLVITMGYKLTIILYQLLGAVRGRNEDVDNDKLEDRLYFIFSLGIMVFKQIFVTVYFSSVDLICQDIVGYLFNVPSHIYNIEIERFIVFIKQSSPVMSGLKLYKLRRSLILTMASVVVVYELVLITFTSN